MKATISEIVPKRLNVSYVAFSFDPHPPVLAESAENDSQKLSLGPMLPELLVVHPLQPLATDRCWGGFL
jgi:hypothetical protein